MMMMMIKAGNLPAGRGAVGFTRGIPSTEWRFMIPSAEEDTIHREILTFYDTKLHK